jgi:hypothetical protein
MSRTLFSTLMRALIISVGRKKVKKNIFQSSVKPCSENSFISFGVTQDFLISEYGSSSSAKKSVFATPGGLMSSMSRSRNFLIWFFGATLISILGANSVSAKPADIVGRKRNVPPIQNLSQQAQGELEKVEKGIPMGLPRRKSTPQVIAPIDTPVGIATVTIAPRGEVAKLANPPVQFAIGISPWAALGRFRSTNAPSFDYTDAQPTYHFLIFRLLNYIWAQKQVTRNRS